MDSTERLKQFMLIEQSYKGNFFVFIIFVLLLFC